MTPKKSLIPRNSSPLEDVWISLDLETTGLSFEGDEIIEMGAVKFMGERVLDTYQTFVNPQRRLNDFVRRYTGITQAEVSGAPPLSTAAVELVSFIGSSPIIGHNLGFDLGFLGKKGLRFSNPRCDTWDMAFVVSPGLPDYSLAKLAEWLGVPHPQPHRAVPDASATMGVFLKLVHKVSALDVNTLAEMQRLAGRSSWVLAYILGRLRGEYPDAALTTAGRRRPAEEQARGVVPITGEGTVEVATGSGRPAAEQDGTPSPSGRAGITGLDTEALRGRLRQGRALRPNQQTHRIDVDFVASLLTDGSPLADAMPGFEVRPQQVAMARAVAEAINEGKRLIVEAGTGVGKSLAYLLPAALYASMNNKRVVVSTNTINLQEQLLNKDVPTVLEALAHVDGASAQATRFTQLKGRANYLCLRRWSHLRASEPLADNEARLLAKTMVWLQTTSTGDRSELNLGHRSAAAPWERLSAQGALECQGMGGPCFLRAAREKAAASHLVIVNHALLLSDVTAGGSLIPDYDVLIIDEAHHLEDEATRHLGFEVTQSRIDDQLQSMTGDRGLLSQVVAAFRGSTAALTRRSTVEKVAAEVAALLPRVREAVARMSSILSSVVGDAAEGSPDQQQELRITSGTRAQPAWSELEMQWENVDLGLMDLGNALPRLQISLEGLEEAGLIGYDDLMVEMANADQANTELRQRLTEFIPQPKADGIYWVTRARQSGDLTLHAAPLHVGETLDELLFSQKECVVMTSATLSTNESFEHLRDRTGFNEAEELLLGSPFDYPRAALLCVPEDMPEPTSWAYQGAVEQAVTDAALAAGGHTMALFTSHASLQATAAAVRANVEAHGVTVLAQGVDGTPRQLAGRFLENPKSLLLGTASFWEGVDLPGESLTVLLVARLPFNVPSEPVFASRSERYDQPFNDYALPQAILRLRQGFGRLIRTNTDKGVAIILDRRIASRRYGKAFLNSLPPGSFKSCRLLQVPDEIRRWIGG